MANSAMEQDALYGHVAAEYSGAIERLARGYQPDPDKRRDLVQDIHVALWRSLERFAGRASLRTWVYRVSHKTAISQITRRRAGVPLFVSIDELAAAPAAEDTSHTLDRRMALERLLALVQGLNPLDRQVILLYLEDLDAQSIADIVGISTSKHLAGVVDGGRSPAMPARADITKNGEPLTGPTGAILQ